MKKSYILEMVKGKNRTFFHRDGFVKDVNKAQQFEFLKAAHNAAVAVNSPNVRIRAQAGEARIGFLGMLCLIFIAAKITGFITWSWWLVLMPILAPMIVAVIVMLVFFVFRKE